MIVNRNVFGQSQQKYNEDMFLKCFKNDEPYTKREFEMELKCSKDTAAKYLKKLEERGFIKSKKCDIGWVYWKV